MPSAENVLSLIGNTPMVKVNHLDTGLCELYLKLESHNPGGSIKDRIALSMIDAAEKDGSLKPGGTLVEATAGNTGLGLALVASQKGYKLVLVIPDKMSQEKIFHLKALGAQVVMTRSDVGIGHSEYYQDMAKRIAAERGGFYVNQFENPNNPVTHERSTGPEIWEQMEHNVDAVVCGVGSGGTLTGLGRYFARVQPNLEMVLADPKGSVLAPYVNDGVMIEAGSWLVEGIGEDFIPKNCELSFVRHAYTISDAESIATAREVLKKEGIICGSSSGTLIASALRYCRAQKSKKRVVSFVCDSGNKYLSKIYNEYWLDDHGMVMKDEAHDLSDLITRPHTAKNAITVLPSDTLAGAYRKMKMYDVSQLPVMGGGKLLGLISEMDILLGITGNPSGFAMKVSDAMTKNLTTIDVSRPFEELLPIFERGMVAIVMEGEQFLGLITPIDLLQYLRKRIGHA
ncbi:MAG: pyridoxal-phosphate dependent enzyme [Rickettsiales bacterium]|jgi:cystathionine beta-synthase|nr:pyridoxal-phosphate dependent enzyme [Rickettsiales bacterium]